MSCTNADVVPCRHHRLSSLSSHPKLLQLPRTPVLLRQLLWNQTSAPAIPATAIPTMLPESRQESARSQNNKNSSAICERNSNRMAESSSSSQRRWRTRPATSSSSLALLLLTALALLGLLLPSAQCATFFYGATEDSGSNPSELDSANEQTLALAENAAATTTDDEREEETEETKLSSQELESVYKFCSLLPLLEQAGHVVKNKQAREVCDKLLVMLKPFAVKRRNKAAAIRPIRARRATLMLAVRRRR